MAELLLPFSTDPLPQGTRVVCRLEYDGSGYHGWQSQAQSAGSTVQDTVQTALSRVADAPVVVQCAGRTDTGVHACGQIIHFDAPCVRSSKAWVMGTNANLPRDIRVHWAVAAPADFHARFSATARRYRYLILNAPIRPALFGPQLSWQRQPLDAQRMHGAAQVLLGEHNFSAFRAAACQSVSANRNVHAVAVTRRESVVLIDIKANAFLQHMVRNIAGSLIAVGCGRQPVDWLAELLAGRDRTIAAPTAPPGGLYLVAVEYPAEFALPVSASPGPLLLPA